MDDYALPIQAIHHDGAVMLFDSFEALLAALARAALKPLVERHVDTLPTGRFIRVSGWLLRDDCGRPVDLGAVRTMQKQAAQKQAAQAQRHRLSRRGPQRRGVPVPGTGRGRGRYFYCFFRRPTTTQEIRSGRALLADADDYPVPVEHVRWRKTLPTAYDDIPRAGPQRSWKRHRRTQWRS